MRLQIRLATSTFNSLGIATTAVQNGPTVQKTSLASSLDVLNMLLSILHSAERAFLAPLDTSLLGETSPHVLTLTSQSTTRVSLLRLDGRAGFPSPRCTQLFVPAPSPFMACNLHLPEPRPILSYGECKKTPAAALGLYSMTTCHCPSHKADDASSA